MSFFPIPEHSGKLISISKWWKK